MPGGWGQSVERASSPDSGRCTWGSRPHPLQGGPEPGLSAGPGTAGGGGLGGSIRAGPRADLPRGTSPPLGTRVAGPGLRGSYLTSRRIFGRRCAVGTTGRWGRSRRDPTPRPLQRARAGRPGQVPTVRGSPSTQAGRAAHPTRGDHGVLEHAAAQLAAQLHRGLLGEHQRLLQRSRVG